MEVRNDDEDNYKNKPQVCRKLFTEETYTSDDEHQLNGKMDGANINDIDNLKKEYLMDNN